jgi:chromosome segregation ATPase
MKEEHIANLSDMRAKLNDEVENKTLALKLLLVERTADLEAARKLLVDLEGSVQELELSLHHVKLEAHEKEQDAEAVLQKAQQEAKEKIDLLESSALTLQGEVENKNTIIDSLQIDLDELRKAFKDKQQEVGEAKAEHERDRKEWEAKRGKTEAMMGDSRENHTMIDFYADLIENMRSELETARCKVIRCEEDRMKTQEDIFDIRDSLRRKEEEHQKLESENIKLLELISRRDQELENLDMETGFNQVVEELKHQLQKCTEDAEKKDKAMKEMQLMMRGTAQLEKQGPPAM